MSRWRRRVWEEPDRSASPFRISPQPITLHVVRLLPDSLTRLGRAVPMAPGLNGGLVLNRLRLNRQLEHHCAA